MIELTDRAWSALGEDEVLVFEWSRIALCCSTAGEPTLRLAPLRTVRRAHRRLPVVGGASQTIVVAHPFAFAHLAKLDITIDCRRLLGVRHFVSDLPTDFGLRVALGRPAPTRTTPDPTGAVPQSLRGGPR